MVVFIMAGSDHLGQHGGRVGNSAAINTTVQVAVRAGYFHFNITRPLTPISMEGCFHTDHGGITYQHHICFNRSFIFLYKCAEIW